MTVATKISPFDIAAKTYDLDFTFSQIGIMQRELVWQMLAKLLAQTKGSLNILEINCGTGEDALQLAKLGHQVIATDASHEMIHHAKQKLKNSGLTTTKPEYITCSFDQLGSLSFKRPFDLVVSNFGGLNCIDDTQMIRLREVLLNMVTNDGRLLLVVLGKCCAWEILYFSLKGKVGNAFRRFKRSVPFNIDNHLLNIYYYSPSRLRKLFQPGFRSSELKPVGLFIPPSYLESSFVKRPHLLQTLNRLEKKFGFRPLSFLADHFCMVLHKNKS